MGMAFDHTFRASIPGSSLTHRWGSFPHTRPPKYVDPNEALNFIWKQLHQKEMLKSIWYYFEQGGTIWHMTRVILYKLAVEGIIQHNLMIVLGPTVAQMLTVLSMKKGIKAKAIPKFKDSTKDTMVNKHITDKLGQEHANLPKSALANTMIPADKITHDANALRKMTAQAPKPTPAPIAPPKQGLLNMQGAQ